jgi:hypothetical protein
MNIRSLKLVIFYGIGILFSNLLASVKSESSFIERNPTPEEQSIWGRIRGKISSIFSSGEPAEDPCRAGVNQQILRVEDGENMEAVEERKSQFKEQFARWVQIAHQNRVTGAQLNKTFEEIAHTAVPGLGKHECEIFVIWRQAVFVWMISPSAVNMGVVVVLTPEQKELAKKVSTKVTWVLLNDVNLHYAVLKRLLDVLSEIGGADMDDHEKNLWAIAWLADFLDEQSQKGRLMSRRIEIKLDGDNPYTVIRYSVLNEESMAKRWWKFW